MVQLACPRLDGRLLGAHRREHEPVHEVQPHGPEATDISRLGVLRRAARPKLVERGLVRLPRPKTVAASQCASAKPGHSSSARWAARNRCPPQLTNARRTWCCQFRGSSATALSPAASASRSRPRW